MHVLLLDIYARPQAPECLSKRMERKAARNPRQVAAQNVNGERGKHEDGAYPEAPVAMHASPVWARVGLANLVAISFVVVFAPGHLFSISALSPIGRRRLPRSASRDACVSSMGPGRARQPRCYFLRGCVCSRSSLLHFCVESNCASEQALRLNAEMEKR